jgi:hypothetical protein
MAQFASDAFGGSSGDTLQTYSASWVKNTGGAVSDAFISNAARVRMGVTGSPAAVYYHTATPGSANYTVACDIVQKSAAGTNLAGVTGRGSTNAFTFYHAAFTDGTGWRLWRVSAGAFTQLGSTTAQTLTNDQAYALVLDMNGTTIRMVRDGTQLVSATDSNITGAGKAGIRHFGSTSQSDTVGIHLDNWVATDDTAAGNTIAVPAGSLTLTGNAPTVATTAHNYIDVPAGALSLTGFAPTVTASDHQTVAVPAGSLTLTANAPTIVVSEHQTIAVPAGTLSLTGIAPTIAVTDHQTIEVPAGTLSLTGLAPTIAVTAHQYIAVPAGSLTLTGFAPTIQNGANLIIDVPAGAITMTGLAPTINVTAHQYIDVPAGALSLTGFAPTVTASNHQTVSVPLAALTLTGYAPNVTTGVVTGTTISVPLGTLSLTAYAPQVNNTTSTGSQTGSTHARQQPGERRPRQSVERRPRNR